ncbi:hypothetical protein MB818_20860 [Ruegeria sp. 1NDH52C]|uniref:Transposase n=1 Tax=Ruegeria alba TaxID=2916756 RepID=A0ABS9P4H1_9RHOB|nr:hypothetical protein [Ruegeria alba]MCG6560665.1 hypothetical protein [Ruegeria alba]
MSSIVFYISHRFHESLADLKPADVYHNRGAKILKMREEIMKKAFRKRRLQHQTAADKTRTGTDPEPPLQNSFNSPENYDDWHKRSASPGSQEMGASE